MSDERDPGAGGARSRETAGARDAQPRSADEALASAARHARAALAESLAALHALLDAASLAASGEPAASRRVLGALARTLDELAAGLDGAGREGPLPLLAAIADALDAEIARWELRARDDADARAVLRSFLGLRELLWEFGVRRPDPRAAPRRGDPEPGPGVTRRARPRIQRVRVEG